MEDGIDRVQAIKVVLQSKTILVFSHLFVPNHNQWYYYTDPTGTRLD